MSKKFFKLNNTTKTLGKIFPALLICTPAVAFSAIIDQSTSVPQDFSADAEYVINKDVTISSAGSEAAVSVTGFTTTTTTNYGNISGTGNGLDINTGEQRILINNDIGATISSTTANAVNIQSMLGDFN
ncbi:autotransporter outer membrane beta-barrel domain-containing protein, partial [Klebsiella pneumoniae]